MSEALDLLAEEIANCESCELCQTRTNAVPGSGSPKARILFVGEGPGEQEDLEGLPFVGRAGELLNEGLARAGMSRNEVFITNIVKCRPPGNRNPHQKEMEACAGYLKAQIEAIQPALIVALGKVAAEYLLQREVKITRENSKLDFLPDGTTVMTVYHPAYVLRNQKQEVREAFFSAFEYARELVYD